MTIRISGLASGFDVDAMVTDLMKAERTKVDNVLRKKQLLEWKRDDYRTVNTKLLALRTSLADLRLQSSFSAKTVSSSDSTVLTATAGTSAVSGTFSVQVASLARGASKESTPVSSTYEHSGGNKSFTLTGKDGSATFTVKNGDSIQTVVSKINAQESATGIKATYDSGTNKFYLFTSETGEDATIQAADTNGFLASTLNLNLDAVQGSDAVIKFNNGADLSFSSNQFTFNNINFNLQKAGETVNITVAADVDASVDKIKDFVEKYNTAVEYISEKLGEKRYRDYVPLTDEEKEEMSESQIDLWETKSKSGLLRGDSTLASLYNSLRSAAGAIVDNDSAYSTLSSVGITTSSWDDKGKLYIDEDKLRTALSEDPEGVMDLFTSSQSGNSEGIAERLYDAVNTNITTIRSTAGSESSSVDTSYIGREISNIEDRVDTMEERLENIQERYYDQFTAMEEAIQTMNSQSEWLTQMLGSTSGS